LSEEEPDVHRISLVISDDPSLTSMLLKVSNSVFYGARREITTVQEAVVRLGLKEVRKLVVDISMVNYVSDLPEGLLDPLQYWQHSIGVAICIEVLHDLIDYNVPNGPQAHVVGLLHDIGRMITSTYLREAHENLPEDPDEWGADENIIEIERERLGIDHAQIGAAVLEHWGLPMKIVNCVRFHHEPEVSPKEQRMDTYLLALADQICRRMRIGNVGEGLNPGIKVDLWKKVGLDPGSEDMIVDRINDQIDKSEVLTQITGMHQ
jgi:putative nucleotidyltransferase with HDIG domain